ncbi:MAG: phage portal protein [Candidatus Accumulibacter meliphilus]|jgi:HK97 family phage portal protein|uniref:phage portal protein n=1 Tax=Candidatus Accumulibacter meliphilus TaxID=2211374 RepID=UPI002FC3C750
MTTTGRHLALRGNAYNRIVANRRGEILELMPVHPDRIRMELMPSGDYRYRVTDRLGVEAILPRGEIWHLRGPSSDGLMGMRPIDLARESLGMALAAQDYGARFFANDAKPTGGWIEFPGSFKDSEAKKVFRESYQAAQSGANRGKVLVLENGMKFHEVGVTNRDAQFLELRKFHDHRHRAAVSGAAAHDCGSGSRDLLEHRAAEPGIRHAHDDAVGRALGSEHRV